MSTTDEARAEAERRYRLDAVNVDNAPNLAELNERVAAGNGFIAGARWQASRKPEAAPSCPTCRHAEHDGRQCLNTASDSECSCDKRGVEAAPSDTDLRELIDVIADRLGEHPKAGNVFDITDEATTMIRLDEGVEMLAEFIAPALVPLLSRSQPVQVEVTDEKVRAGAIAGLDAVQPTWRATDSEPTPDDLAFVRAALSAALGGGDPVACNCRQDGAHDLGSAGCVGGGDQ